MSLVRRIANLFSRSKVERDIDDELRVRILRCEWMDNVAAGMSKEEARRDACCFGLGTPVVMKERVAGADAAAGVGQRLDRCPVWVSSVA